MAPRVRACRGEADVAAVAELIRSELSEPYTAFTFRYFMWQWPELCWLAFEDGEAAGGVAHGAAEASGAAGGGAAGGGEGRCVGCVVAKADRRGDGLRGYIAMVVVEAAGRGQGLGTELAQRSIRAMAAAGCTGVALEAEVTNAGALALYRNLGFVREKRLLRYYLNNGDAFRLKLKLRPGTAEMEGQGEQEAGEPGTPGAQ